MDEINLIFAEEKGEKIGRNRTLKWVKFLLSYKSQEDVEDMIGRMISRDGASDPELAKLKRY